MSWRRAAGFRARENDPPGDRLGFVECNLAVFLPLEGGDMRATVNRDYSLLVGSYSDLDVLATSRMRRCQAKASTP